MSLRLAWVVAFGMLRDFLDVLSSHALRVHRQTLVLGGRGPSFVLVL